MRKLSVALFCLTVFPAQAVETINVLPEPSEASASYGGLKNVMSADISRMTEENAVLYADQIKRVILKQKNANVLISRGFPMPFQIDEVNQANRKLLSAYSEKPSAKTLKEIKGLFSRFLDCSEDKTICLNTVPDDLSKFLTLSAAEQKALPEVKKISFSPVPEIPEDGGIEESRLFYDRILLNRLKEKAQEALERETPRGFDDSVSYLTLTAEDFQRRQNEKYKDFSPAVSAKTDMPLFDMEESIKDTLYALPMNRTTSALCSTISTEHSFKNAQQKLSYTDLERRNFTFETNVNRKTDEQPLYFISIDGMVLNDGRLSERFLPAFRPRGFFEYKNRLFSIFVDEKEEYHIFEFDADVYAFLPVCLLNKDRITYQINAEAKDFPLCTDIVRKEYNVYPAKPLSQKLSATELRTFFEQFCSAPEQGKCVTGKLYDFSEATGFFADYDNDGNDDILYRKENRLSVYSPEKRESTELLETNGRRQKIIQAGEENYLLTTSDDEREYPQELYKFEPQKKPERICSFTAKEARY